jgi:hypothetical protein
MTDVTGRWKATHRTPREGIDAWNSPDPAVAPASELEGRVEVQLMDTAGEWARVRGQNGWEGWVDGRLLQQIDVAGAPGDLRAYLLLAGWIVVLVIVAIMGLTS